MFAPNLPPASPFPARTRRAPTRRRTSSEPAALQLPLPLEDLPFTYDRGLQLSGADFWLDPHSRRQLAYVSHGHSDHCLPHGHAVATPATAEFYRLRTRRSSVTELAFNQPHQVQDQQLELFPAGHVLGAAQAMVTGPDGRRLVYTGDFKLRPAPCQDAAEVRPCEVLVMECTFGQPRYQFPSIPQIEAELRDFVERCFAQDVVPVVCGYVLGKSQEALCLLGRAGYTVALHESILSVVKVYERQGVRFGPYELLSTSSGSPGSLAGPMLAGKVVLCPPHLRKTVTATLPRHRTVMLTGWAVDRSARYRYGVDEMIALSDHADFNELLEYVERAAPRVVYTLHGDRAFSLYLRSQGIEAHHLEG